MFDNVGGVRRWVRQWSITVHWDRPENSPWHTTKFQRHLATPAELRRWVEAARADPHVTRFPYQSIRVLVGDEPTHCPAGHPYQKERVAGRLVWQNWSPCCCGGHFVLLCTKPAELHRMQQLGECVVQGFAWSMAPTRTLQTARTVCDQGRLG